MPAVTTALATRVCLRDLHTFPFALAELIAKYARKARLHKHVTPHTFRHTCATALVRNNAGIRYVQEMLGHAQLSTTQEYVRLTINDLKEAHSRFHPREKDHD